MTNQATLRNWQRKQKKKQTWRKNMLRCACWNIQAWNGKEQEVLLEMKEHNIDVCALSETKRKGKGDTTYPGYILKYSGPEKHKRASAGVGLLIKEKFKHNIEETLYVNERILRVTLDINKGKIHFFSVYAPDSSKSGEETEKFYNELELELEKIPKEHKILIMGDMNARIGNAIIRGVKHRFNEPHVNANGQKLINFCVLNEMRINNTFFDHKPQQKITWSNSRGQTSMIDYIISNRSIHPTQIIDTRALTSANIGSDHHLILAKIRLTIQLKKKQPTVHREKLNIEILQDETVRALYGNRLRQKIQENNIREEDDVETSWSKIKQNMRNAAEEALGKRTVNKNTTKNTTPWYTSEVKQIAKEKRNAYLRYLNGRSPIELQKYKEVRNKANAKMRKIKNEYWETFTADMEHDLYGAQKKIWTMLRRGKQEINEYAQTQTISKETWVTYFKQLYQQEETEQQEERVITQSTTTKIELEHVAKTAKALKNRKTPGPDEIHNEMIKYGGEELHKELTKLFQKVLDNNSIPTDWKKSITIPIFKKGDKKLPGNYRGITLLGSAMKLFTRILGFMLSELIPISEEQQGFRKNRSTTDAIFVIRQIVEKSIEFNKPAYMCFIDLTKAFDRVRLKDIVDILKERNAPTDVTRTIEALNKNTTTSVLANNNLTEEVPISSGIRQGDSLSPILFNLVMDKIIAEVRNAGQGYRTHKGEISIMCYADDAVIISENEDELQRLLQQFYMTARHYNMEISTQKTKTLVTAKEPIRCKLAINDRIIEQVMSFRYLGVTISANQDRKSETQEQANRAARIAGCLKESIWRNKHMSRTSKIRIYKTCIRPIMTYAAETRADTRKTKEIARTNEMKVLRSIVGCSLRDRIPNAEIREMCEIQDVVRWTRQRRKDWKAHVDRMEDDRIAKIFRDRNLEYMDGNAERRRRDVSCGVPQGSVLGPLLWNLAYDSILRSALPPGCKTVCYADDTLIMAGGRNWGECVARANLAVARTTRAIRVLGLRVAPQKTEAVFFHNGRHGAPPRCRIRVEDTQVEVGTQIKYLGLHLDSRWSFQEHFRRLAPRVEKTAVAISRLLPNLGGPDGSVRRLYAGTVHSMLLYGAPIWAEKVCATRKLRDLLRRVQRRVALRTCRGYRTVSGIAAGVISGIPPAELLARMYADVYRRTCELKAAGEQVTDRVRCILRMHFKRILIERWMVELREPGPGRRTIEAILPIMEEWLEREHGGTTFRMTQILTGHGCFGEYLGRIGKERGPACHHCDNARDDAQHTLAECAAWMGERAELTAKIGPDLTLPTVIAAMVGSKERWTAFSSFCEKVMAQKEEKERERERDGSRRREWEGRGEESEEDGGEPPPSNRGRLCRRSPPPDDLSGRGAWVRGLCLGRAAAPHPVSKLDTG